jgi:REP element-mobilizing transposase RayT
MEVTVPQSFAAMYAHLVFSTKNCVAMIQPAWSSRLYDYVGGIVSNRRGALLDAGGMPDHIHLLVSFGREWSLADLLRDVKAGSSKWIHDTFADQRLFEWQSGYAAFSVSASNLDNVKQYIADQPRHHRSRSFQDELRALLKRHGLTWDEQYVWD